MENKINALSIIAKPYIERIFNEITLIIQNDYEKLKVSNPQYKESLRVNSILETRIYRIILGILDLVLEDNIYSSKILLRSLIEHCVKLDYLTQKSLTSKNDNIFKEYLLFNDLAEELQYLKGLNYTSKILNKTEIDNEALQDLINRKPEIKQYSENQIFEKASQFTFRNMFKFINETKDRDPFDLNNDNYRKGFEAFLHIGALYSDLSSFVHGGPSADKFVLLMHLDKEEQDFEVLNMIEQVMAMNFYACIIFIAFCNKLDNKYDPNIQRIFDCQLEYYDKI